MSLRIFHGHLKYVLYDSTFLSVVQWRFSKGMYLCINYSVSTIINPENTAAGKYLQRELYVLRVLVAGALGQRGADVGRPRAGEGLVRAGTVAASAAS